VIVDVCMENLELTMLFHVLTFVHLGTSTAQKRRRMFCTFEAEQ